MAVRNTPMNAVGISRNSATWNSPKITPDGQHQRHRAQPSPQAVQERSAEGDFLADARQHRDEKEQLPHGDVLREEFPAELLQHLPGDGEDQVGEAKDGDAHQVSRRDDQQHAEPRGGLDASAGSEPRVDRAGKRRIISRAPRETRPVR